VWVMGFQGFMGFFVDLGGNEGGGSQNVWDFPVYGLAPVWFKTVSTVWGFTGLWDFLWIWVGTRVGDLKMYGISRFMVIRITTTDPEVEPWYTVFSLHFQCSRNRPELQSKVFIEGSYFQNLASTSGLVETVDIRGCSFPQLNGVDSSVLGLTTTVVLEFPRAPYPG
ncbi:hypothetical protein FA15DRAFT_655092, partial [Coprinopsis marcescibilis]